jgi:hypothetical protein
MTHLSLCPYNLIVLYSDERSEGEYKFTVINQKNTIQHTIQVQVNILNQRLCKPALQTVYIWQVDKRTREVENGFFQKTVTFKIQFPISFQSLLIWAFKNFVTNKCSIPANENEFTNNMSFAMNIKGNIIFSLFGF